MTRTALICVDVQRDFLPGGALGVPEGDYVVAPLIRAGAFVDLIVATRDWHPKDHCSFRVNGGPWPMHCVQDTPGAELDPAIANIASRTISKGENPDVEQYSGMQGTHLGAMLKKEGFGRLLIGGLATDYCVRATVLDALKEGFQLEVLTDAVRGVDLEPGDSERALAEMERAGAELTTSVAVAREAS